MLKKWWHNTIGYQIYPKSFQDTNGDGIGDLKGITAHLDDLVDLGINVIWICPINKSPMKDHGYDISDYEEIDSIFGCKDDLRELIQEAHKRGIKILMDLVVNHTSSEHPWFQKALEEPGGEYGKYYIIQEGKDGKEPNNWRSIFGGSAWERIKDTNLYYLHLFTKWQPDLNWENPILRQRIYNMVNRWLDLGISGFRIDAISHLKKDFTYKNLPSDGVDGFVNGFPYFSNVDGIGTFLRELQENTFKHYDAMTIGEVDEGLPADVLWEFIGENGYFSTIFDFCHSTLHVNSTEWKDKPVEMIDELKKRLFAKQNTVKGKGILCNYLENHDLSRIVERFIPTKEIDFYSKSMVGGINFFMPGIVFLYQGQTIGMMDYQKENIEEFEDPTTFIQYDEYLQNGMTKTEALAQINLKTREHARTPMQWNDGKYAGFSSTEPWFSVNPNYRQINYDLQKKNPDSLYAFYKKMISLRKSDEFQELFIYGEFTPIYETEPGIIGYERRLNDKRVLIINNAKSTEAILQVSGTIKKILLSNYKNTVLQNGIIKLHRYQLLILERV
ncbi:MAG: alpha-glucosidase [Lachnospiraceae bacterium]|nr:alpha-glucosidase [Lachnospiraceae bacterium]